VGPVLARRIVEERERRGGFRSVDDLIAVKGIGSAVLEGLRERVRVGPGR
jgi:competence protein ComEA